MIRIKKIQIAIAACVCLLLSAASTSAVEFEQKAFPNKLIYTETPEIGQKWHGGIRMNDIFIWDGYLNTNDWMIIDVLHAGLPNLFGSEGGSLTDNLSAFTFKSRPFTHILKNNTYKVAGGIKIYNANFEISDSTKETLMESKDNSLVLFLTQSYLFNGKHYFNFFTSLSFRTKKFSDGSEETSTTYYIIPGYKLPISKNWNFAIEYYMTNTEQLPIKILQYVYDPDQLDFLNSARDMYSFMFWGFNYTTKHLRIDLNFANHITFQGLKLPLIGIGYNF